MSTIHPGLPPRLCPCVEQEQETDLEEFPQVLVLKLKRTRNSVWRHWKCCGHWAHTLEAAREVRTGAWACAGGILLQNTWGLGGSSHSYIIVACLRAYKHAKEALHNKADTLPSKAPHLPGPVCPLALHPLLTSLAEGLPPSDPATSTHTQTWTQPLFTISSSLSVMPFLLPEESLCEQHFLLTKVLFLR